MLKLLWHKAGLVIELARCKRELNKWIYQASVFEKERDVYREIVNTWVKQGRESLIALQKIVSEKT